jgi:spermidine synthase
MKKWTLLDRAITPDGSPISLHEHDGSYSIRMNGVELMSTRKHASEEKLAELACAHLKGVRRARVLIGGLGFGFTLKAALAVLPGDAQVVVAEILPVVIEWNRNPAFPLAADAMADRRVVLVQRDVHDVIRESPAGFDSIMLDVDNGPAALSTEANERLYDSKGLQLMRGALKARGCVAVWSAVPDPAFERLLARAGFRVQVERCRSHSTSGGWHTIFVGRVGS